nr:reverse transcriptase domain-containing protein [Tanacetum cinerariifolium]
MADNRTMAQMLQAPIEGYEDAIVVPPINANNFKLKRTLINLVQSNQFTRRQDPHNHLLFFNKVTSTFRHPEMTDNRTMAQMLQAPVEGYEDAIVVSPINANNFELKQTLINLVQSNQFTGRQDPHNHLRFFNKVTSTFRHLEVPNTTVKLLLFPFSLEGEIAAALEDKLDIRMNRFEKSLNEMKNFIVTPTAPLKAVTEVCVTCGSNHSYNQCPLTRGGNDYPNLYNKPSTLNSSSLPSNTIPNPKGEAKAITTRSGMSYKEPPIPPTGVNQQEPVEVTKDTEPQNSDDIHPPTVQAKVHVDKPTDEPVV